MDCSALAAWANGLPDGPELLFSNAELLRYVELARYLDLNGTSYYAECRLHCVAREPTAKRTLDLLVAFDQRDASRGSLLGTLTHHRQLASAATRSAWQQSEAFVKRWTDANDELCRLVSTIWLEFDDVERGFDSVAPSLSACIVRGYDRNYRVPAQAAHAEDARVLCSVYEALVGAECVDRDMFERLRAATLALPRSGKFIHLSLMSARSPASVKLYGVMRREDFADYLRRIEWRGSFEMLERALRELATSDLCGEWLYFDLNLTNMWDERRWTLGLAFAQQQISPNIDGDVTRRALLERLTAQGQCAESQSQRLGSWPGSFGLSTATSTRARVKRWLDIKTVLFANGAIESKAYLGFQVNHHPFVIGA